MPDCPMPLQGWHYNTHLIQICNAYHRCPVCSMCQNYDAHSAMCGRCEGRKPRQYRTCTCSSKAKEIHKKAEEVFKQPLFSPEGLDGSLFGKPGGYNVAEDSGMEKLGKDMHEHLGGGIDHRLGSVPGLAGVDAFDDHEEDNFLDSKGNVYGG